MIGSQKIKILVVDDEGANIEVLQSILGDRYRVIPATNGRKALELAHKHKPDLILLDIMMPELDGYAVCEQLKADPSTSLIPVIFVTAMDAEQDELQGFKLGAVDYITKPVSAPIVLARVATHLRLISAEQSLYTMDMVLGGAKWWVVSPLRQVFAAVKGTPIESKVNTLLRQALNMLEQGRLYLQLQKIHFKKEPLELRAILTELLKEQDAGMHLKNTFLDRLEGAAHVVGDEQRLQEALGILLDNAVSRSMKEQAVKVELCTGINDKAIMIGFSYHGKMIPAAEIPFLFNPFPTEDASGKDGRTANLALANAAVIVQRHGGSISCESGGEITFFSVSLPRAQDEQT